MIRQNPLALRRGDVPCWGRAMAADLGRPRGTTLKSLRRVALGVATAALMFAGTTTPAHAVTAPHIGPALAFGAPTGQKGGVENPVAYCDNYNVEPRTRWVLKNPDTGYSRTFTWRGALPGIAFPRVAVGSYTSRTTAWCGSHRAVRTQTVSVTQKTARTTISRAEFRSIHRGMSVAKVRDIVGYRGKAAVHWDGKSSRVYDMMAFWRWTQIVYRDGRVVAKYWDVDHD